MTRQMRGTKIPVRSETESKVIDGWLASTAQESTARTYEYVINKWIKWCRANKVDPLNPQRSDIDIWRKRLIRQYADVTVKKKLSALSSMLKYGMSEHDGLVADNPIARITLPKVSNVSNREALDCTETGRVLVASLRHGRCDAAVVHLLVWSGIRVTELRSARCDGFTTHDGEQRLLIKRKGGYRESVHVPRVAMQAVTDYLAGRSYGPLILGSRGLAISRHEVARIVTRAVTAAQITGKHITPHSLRHTYATLSLKAGADPLAVQKEMGHSTFATTQRYNHNAVRTAQSPAHALARLLAGAP